MTETSIRLLVCDVDGTLVRHDKSLPGQNVAAVRDLIGRGVDVSLISARPPAGLFWIAQQLGIPGPMAGFNGGTIFQPGGRELQSFAVPHTTARGLIEIYARPRVTTWLFASGAWLTSDPDNAHTPREILSSGLNPQPVRDFGKWLGTVEKIVAVCDDGPVMAAIEAEAREMAGVTATVMRSQDYYLDATAPQANKGDGVARLAELHGVALENVAVIGDQANDLPMFARAGFAIAMGQARAEVQAAADEVAASNEDAGVADAIARFVLPRI